MNLKYYRTIIDDAQSAKITFDHVLSDAEVEKFIIKYFTDGRGIINYYKKGKNLTVIYSKKYEDFSRSLKVGQQVKDNDNDLEYRVEDTNVFLVGQESCFRLSGKFGWSGLYGISFIYKWTKGINHERR